MSSQNQEELKRKDEEVKQDADVQHALQQATATEKAGIRARGRDIVWIATQLIFLIILGGLYSFIKYRVPQFAFGPLLKLILATGVVIVCFTVLRLGPKPPTADALLAAFAKRNLPVRAVDVPSPVARDLYERDIVVVRPDQHVAWRGNADPPDAADVVAQMTGNK